MLTEGKRGRGRESTLDLISPGLEPEQKSQRHCFEPACVLAGEFDFCSFWDSKLPNQVCISDVDAGRCPNR